MTAIPFLFVDLSEDDTTNNSASAVIENSAGNEKSESSRIFQLQAQVDQDSYTIQLKTDEIRRLTMKNKEYENEVCFIRIILLVD